MGSDPNSAPRSGRCEGREGVVCARVCLAEASVGLHVIGAVISRTGGAALQVRGGTEGKGGGIEGADARQSAARSTAPRRTHAQTTSSPSIMPLPAGEASRPPTASGYRIKQELDADGGSAVAGDAIAIGGLGLRPPRRRLAGSACCSHASLLD